MLVSSADSVRVLEGIFMWDQGFTQSGGRVWSFGP